MKNLLLVAIATFISTTLFSQNLPIPTKWKIKKFGISFGPEEDLVNKMDGNYLLETAFNTQASEYKNLNMDKSDMYGGVCENPQLRFMAFLEVPHMKNVEFQIGANALFNRVDGAYFDTQLFNSNTNSFEYSYLSINSTSHEGGLEFALIKRLPLNILNFYGGVGTNIGYSFGGKLEISGNDESGVQQNMNRSFNDIANGFTYEDEILESYELKNGFHQRGYVHLGLGIMVFNQLEFGVTYRGGIGYRSTIDGPTKRTRLNSIGLSAKYIL